MFNALVKYSFVLVYLKERTANGKGIPCFFSCVTKIYSWFTKLRLYLQCPNVILSSDMQEWNRNWIKWQNLERYGYVMTVSQLWHFQFSPVDKKHDLYFARHFTNMAYYFKTMVNKYFIIMTVIITSTAVWSKILLS